MKSKSIFLLAVFFCFMISHSPVIKADEANKNSELKFDSLFRSYYINDQRIQWSGLEATFGVEAVLTPIFEKKVKWGKIVTQGEFFINQPFEKNILSDRYRDRYQQNFAQDTLEISQLSIYIETGRFVIGLGKHPTLFGKEYGFNLENSFIDHPFIRTESILRRETGFFIRYCSGIFSLDLALVNGGTEKDTNSSKGGVIRLAMSGKNWATGFSAKFQDGTGSEQQKMYKNHAGMDLLIRWNWGKVWGELIYDQYGFHHPFDPENIFWPRSFYYRDVFYKDEKPIWGIGGYIGVEVDLKPWTLSAIYGHYHPQQIGHIYHDQNNDQGLLKWKLAIAKDFELIGFALVENKHIREAVFSGAKDYAFMLGAQYSHRIF